jgi:hypothetical protein
MSPRPSTPPEPASQLEPVLTHWVQLEVPLADHSLAALADALERARRPQAPESASVHIGLARATRPAHFGPALILQWRSTASARRGAAGQGDVTGASGSRSPATAPAARAPRGNLVQLRQLPPSPNHAASRPSPALRGRRPGPHPPGAQLVSS